MNDPGDAARRQTARAALRLNDADLVAQCEIEFFTAGGPGGQHRNKTESAVRLRHVPTQVVASATERRSQAQNRGVALERLRAALKELSFEPKVRRQTKPTRSSKRRRLDAKKRQGTQKALRRGDDW